MTMFKVGDRVRVKKNYRNFYDGVTDGIVRRVLLGGTALKVEFASSNRREPAERWVDASHLEEGK